MILLPKYQKGQIIQPTGDPYEYMESDGNYYSRKRGTSNWNTAQGDALTAIKSNIFNVKEPIKTTRAAYKSIPSSIERYDRSIPCVGKGCAQIVADTYEFVTKSNFPARQDAWYMKAALEKQGKQSVDVNNLQPGDILMLDRPGEKYSKKKSAVPGFDLSDNYGNEHVGIVVPVKDKSGEIKLSVYHGGYDPVNGSFYEISPLDNIELKKYGLKYKVKGAVRPSEDASKKFLDFMNIEPSPANIFSSNTNEVQDRFLKELNKNYPYYKNDFKLNDKELTNIMNISYGVLKAESKNQENPVVVRGNVPMTREFKEKLARIVTGDPSYGMSQSKKGVFYNQDESRTTAGKYMGAYGINSMEDLDKPEGAANAIMLNLIQNYKILKSQNPQLSDKDLYYRLAGSYKYSPFGEIPYEDTKTNAYANKVFSQNINNPGVYKRSDYLQNLDQAAMYVFRKRYNREPRGAGDNVRLNDIKNNPSKYGIKVQKRNGGILLRKNG